MHWVCRGPDEGVDRNTAVPKVGRMSGRPTLRWSENDAARPEFPRLSTGTDVCIGPHRKVKPSLSRSIGENSATGLAENPPAIFRGAFDRARELRGGTGGGTDRSVSFARRIWVDADPSRVGPRFAQLRRCERRAPVSMSFGGITNTLAAARGSPSYKRAGDARSRGMDVLHPRRNSHSPLPVGRWRSPFWFAGRPSGVIRGHSLPLGADPARSGMSSVLNCRHATAIRHAKSIRGGDAWAAAVPPVRST